mgnify:CR=1 FL=1
MEPELLRDKMEKVLTHLVNFLSDSKESPYGDETPEELIAVVSSNLQSIKSSGLLSSPEKMTKIFLPTASLQEIAQDNGWGNQYIELAEHFELALKACS